ncbi:eukaryotic translation initiation factor eIF2A family protein [Lyngbya aestuarii BL J]|uniref:Eukaryotic translation initiation factor eIF2A family protein n=1 Tax=Lyngbya aestuarii BL J TaxID=1348334 RepID=U7QI25_9CYAN|nr:caspase family protein [Lyngbya aestuarii]ERT07624.1 eukaryotic translation initiation factor eIF2A family protein [Lyngbya aestuarii BL J]
MIWSLDRTHFNRNIAVVIGINNYQHGIHRLKTAVNDAEAIANLLEKEYKYQIIRLFPGKHEDSREATLTEFNQLLFETLPQKIKPTEGDRLLFYFAGHGIARNSEDGPAGAIIPQDAQLGNWETYLPMKKLNEALSKLECHHLLVVLDCCFAGNFRWSSHRNVIPELETIHREHYDRFIRYPAWQAITSAAHNQEALDYTDERGIAPDSQHSPFAKALINGLKDIKADFTKDGIITAPELYLYLRDRLIDKDGLSELQTAGLWPLPKHDRGEFILTLPGFVPEKLKPAPPLNQDNNPYRGLESFDEKYSELFFGRTELIEELHKFIKDQALSVVLGASGSGKSSLVKAGLIPKLRKYETNKWCILPPIRPGETPLIALNNALKEAKLPEVIFTNPQQNLASSIKKWAKDNPNTKLLIFIDQSEEIITLCKDEEKRQQFFQQILTAIDAHRDKLRVILSLRSDFEPQVRDAGFQFIPEGYSVKQTELKNRWQNGRFMVSAMTRGELREAIQKPAEARVMFFQPQELVEKIVDEVADMPGALPLLSFALSELYLKYLERQRQAKIEGIIIERTMIQEDYQDLGGVILSLTQKADEEDHKLVAKDLAYEQVIRHVMLRMIALGGGELVRRRVPLSELEYPPEKQELVDTVIDNFTAARLLVKGTDSEEKNYVEPAHDALVSGWQKLLTWKQKYEESLLLQRRLTVAAEEWDERARNKPEEAQKGIIDKTDPVLDWLDQRLLTIENRVNKIPALLSQVFGRLHDQKKSSKEKDDQQKSSSEKSKQFLWNGNPYLNVLNETLDSKDNWLNQTEVKFVKQSTLQRRKNASWRWRIAIAVMLGLSSLTIWALIGLRDTQIAQIRNLRQSTEQKRLSKHELEALLDVLQIGKLLDNWLLSLFKPDAEIQQLRITLPKVVYTVQELNRLETQGRPVMALDFQSTPNGEMIVTRDSAGIAVWHLDGRLEKKYTFDEVNAIVQQSNGNFCKTLEQKSLLPVLNCSPDGKMFARGDLEGKGTVNLWKSDGSWHKTFKAHNRTYNKAIMTVRFSPDSQMIATGTWGNEVSLWKLDGTLYKTLEGHSDPVNALDFSRDGQMIASASNDGTVKLWNRDGTLLKTLEGDKSQVWGVSISPDSQMIASASNDGSEKLWNRDGTLLKTLEGHRNTVRAVGFSADGHILASASDDGTVKLWKLGNTPLTILDDSDVVYTARFNPDGKTIATTSGHGNVTLWQKDGTLLKKTEKWQSGPITALEFSPDGQLIVSAAGDRTVKLSRADGSDGKLLEGHTGETQLKEVQSVSFSPDSQIFAIGDVDGKIELWNRDRTLLKTLEGHNATVSGLSFSPDGQIFASASWDGAVKLWNRDGSFKQTLRDQRASLLGVAFSPDKQPDDQIIAAASADGTVKLWKRDGIELKPLVGHNDQVKAVAFSPNGQLIATASYDKTVKLWNRDGTLLKTFYGHNDLVNAVAFSPDGKRLASASNDKTVKLWNLDLDLDVGGLRKYTCNWMRDYLQNNPNVSKSDRRLCDDVPSLNRNSLNK